MDSNLNVENNKKGYLVGILIGLLFSLPWVLVFAFLNVSSGYLAILIVYGVIKGYKIVNKEIYNDKNTKLYLIISSIIIVLLGIFVLIPLLCLLKMGDTSSEMIKFLYTSQEFLNSMVIDAIIALIMVLIPSLLLPIDFKLKNSNKSETEIFTDEIVNIFNKHKALSKETAVDKNIIKDEINNINLGHTKKVIYLDILKNSLIKSYKDNWYLNDKYKSNNKVGLNMSFWVLILFVTCWNVFGPMFFDVDTKYNSSLNSVEKAKLVEFKINDELYINMPDCLKLYSSYKDTENIESYYYQYLTQNVNKSDIEVVEIQYYPIYMVEMTQEIKDYMREYYSEYNIIEEEDKLINGKNVMYFKLDGINGTRLTNVYLLPVGDGFVELYVYINSKNYDKSDDRLSDEIASSVKVIK